MAALVSPVTHVRQKKPEDSSRRIVCSAIMTVHGINSSLFPHDIRGHSPGLVDKTMPVLSFIRISKPMTHALVSDVLAALPPLHGMMKQ